MNNIPEKLLQILKDREIQAAIQREDFLPLYEANRGHLFTDGSNVTRLLLESEINPLESSLMTEIPVGCFAFMDIEDIKIPARITKIDNGAFKRCLQLQSVVFEQPSQVKAIGSDTFADCTNLLSIDIPDSIEILWWEAFRDCMALATVNISSTSSLKSIAADTFAGTALKEIFIPHSIQKIGHGAFATPTLESITYDGTRSRWKRIVGKTKLFASYKPNCIVHCNNGDLKATFWADLAWEEV